MARTDNAQGKDVEIKGGIKAVEICGKLLWKTRHRASRGPETDSSERGWPDMRSSVEQAVGACSACAGDYEDPDRTAGVGEELVGRADEGKRSSGEGEFPVQET